MEERVDRDPLDARDRELLPPLHEHFKSFWSDAKHHWAFFSEWESKSRRFNIELVTDYSNSSGSGIEGGHHTDGAKEEAGK